MQAFAAMGTSSLPYLREAARTGPDQIKSDAISALESSEFDFKREEIVAIWIERLDDPSPSIRLHAARLLGKAKPIRAQAAIQPLQNHLNDPDPEVSATIGAAFSNLNTYFP
jgi:HEAT repeat protein